MRLIYDECEGGEVYVKSFAEVLPAEFREKISEYLMVGYEIRENRMDINHIAVLKRGEDLALVAYYPKVREMRVVTEPSSNYFSFKDNPCEEKTETLITQIDLEDYGISYVIRLSDGRFIVFDGGWDFEPDADKLMKCLSEQSPHERPIIAAWIMTHPHIDHYRCYIVFSEKYSDKVEIQRFIYNFPDAVSDAVRHPDLEAEYEQLEIFYAAVRKSGAEVYRAHTGEVFELSGCKMEVLSSPDDTFFVPVRDLNEHSLVIKMTLSGQTILWTGDCYFASARLAQRWGRYLKSDIMQAPHHLFVGGDKECYALIDPHTCLIPSTEELAYGTISMHAKSSFEVNRYLFFDLNVQDFLAGGNGNFEIKIPYVPRTNGRRLFFDKVEKIQKGLGAESWYFDSVTDESCEFVIINSIRADATVYADLIFDDSSKIVFNVKIEVPSLSFKRVNLLDKNSADPNALYFNRNSLAKMGVPHGEEFVVHFKSDKPVVIKGNKPAAYYS